MSESRSEFEAWAVAGAMSIATLDRFTHYPKGTYEDSRTYAAWLGWQASRRAALEEAIGTLDEFEPSMSDDGVCYYLREIEMAIRSLAQTKALEG